MGTSGQTIKTDNAHLDNLNFDVTCWLCADKTEGPRVPRILFVLDEADDIAQVRYTVIKLDNVGCLKKMIDMPSPPLQPLFSSVLFSKPLSDP